MVLENANCKCNSLLQSYDTHASRQLKLLYARKKGHIFILFLKTAAIADRIWPRIAVKNGENTDGALVTQQVSAKFYPLTKNSFEK